MMMVDFACVFDHRVIVTSVTSWRQLVVGTGVGVGAGDKTVMILLARMLLGFLGSGL